MSLALVILTALAIALGPAMPAAALPASCERETGLAARSDVVFCEPWEDSQWWRNGYVGNPRLLDPAPATPGNVQRTALETEGCVSGKCLRVNMLKGQTGALSLHWPLKNAGLAPEQLHMRYYIKLGPTWDPNMCDDKGAIVGHGGKFPGPADTRVEGDPAAPGGQCGNGGERGDGINCWSHRAEFRACGRHGGFAKGVCSTKPGAAMRFGGYLYYYGQEGGTGSAAPWDSDYWGQFDTGGGTCETNPRNLFCSVPRAKRGVSGNERTGLGMNAGVFVREVWYAVETFVKMNTPGVADGIVRGWVDGQLAYEKTNMVFRLPGHKNLHVRTAWLDVYKGGTQGNCRDMSIWLDQMVLATDGPIAPLPKAKGQAAPAPAPARVPGAGAQLSGPGPVARSLLSLLDSARHP